MELFGISVISLVLGIIGGGWLALKWFAPKTEAKWDDSIVDVIEGIANTLEVDPDELAKKSLGKLKDKTIK